MKTYVHPTLVLNIEVTAEDIRQGVAEDCEHCPIALAVWRALASRGYGACRVKVCENRIGILMWPAKAPSNAHVQKVDFTPVPNEAKRFIKSFDHNPDGGLFVQPFEFTAFFDL